MIFSYERFYRGLNAMAKTRLHTRLAEEFERRIMKLEKEKEKNGTKEIICNERSYKSWAGNKRRDRNQE